MLYRPLGMNAAFSVGELFAGTARKRISTWANGVREWSHMAVQS
jgi:hypothetical protein